MGVSSFPASYFSVAIQCFTHYIGAKPFNKTLVMTLDSLACPLCLQDIRFFVRRGNAAGYPGFSEEFE